MSLPPASNWGAPPNLTEQRAAATVLLETVQAGLAARVEHRDADPRQQRLDIVFCALRRVVGAGLDGLEVVQRRSLAAALVGAMGDLVGRMLADAPDDVVQAAMMTLSNNFLSAMGADPTRSGADVTISSGENKESLH